VSLCLCIPCSFIRALTAYRDCLPRTQLARPSTRDNKSFRGQKFWETTATALYPSAYESGARYIDVRLYIVDDIGVTFISNHAVYERW